MIDVEPGSRVFRIRTSAGDIRRFSSLLLHSADKGDVLQALDDIDGGVDDPALVASYPWGAGGGIIDFDEARRYLDLLHVHATSGFRRDRWRVILSPYVLDMQKHAWMALLGESTLRQWELVSNLDALSLRLGPQTLGCFLLWGASGGDLGVGIGGETYDYCRLFLGETLLVERLGAYLERYLGAPVPLKEAYRVLCVLGEGGLRSPGERLVEVALGGRMVGQRVAVEERFILGEILAILGPCREAIESFVRGLSAHDQSALFDRGIELLGGARSLALLEGILSQGFEVPVFRAPNPDGAVLRSYGLG